MTSRVIAAMHAAAGDHAALSDEQRSLNYRQLREAVAMQAELLSASHVHRCAVLADNGIAWVVADLALLQLGVLHVPVPPWFTGGQIAHVLDDAGVDFILTDKPDRVLRDHREFRLASVAAPSQLSLLRREPATASPAVPADIAKVTYTSGSTATPKGVCLTVEAMERVAHSLAAAISVDADRHLCAMPLSTLLENIAGVYTSILLGACCIVPSTHTLGIGHGTLDATTFVTAIARTAPRSLIVPPELLRVLVVTARRGWTPPAELRFIAVGGASVAQSLLDEARALSLPAYQGYGLSECASVVCLNTPHASRPGSVGRALPHAAVRIDAQGQILVRGAVMHGYLGQDCARTEIATGDLGSIDADGYVYVHGRLKNMFITSMGRNVCPEWVEKELTCDPCIGQAVVCGEARPWPIALIHPAAAQVTERQIDRAVASANERLPAYAQVRRWALLPEPLSFTNGLLTANGRPRRDALAARHTSVIDALYRTALAS